MAQKNLFIAISFYLFIAMLCAKMSRANKALRGSVFTGPCGHINHRLGF